jgi:hypothetical protein
MIGYALGSFFGMIFISTIYGLIYSKVAKIFSEKITQAWKHRPARFIILVLVAIQAILGILLYLFSIYKLYVGGTFTPYPSDYGYEYTGESDIMLAWGAFALAMGISFISDILKGIFVITFAD